MRVAASHALTGVAAHGGKPAAGSHAANNAGSECAFPAFWLSGRMAHEKFVRFCTHFLTLNAKIRRCSALDGVGPHACNLQMQVFTFEFFCFIFDAKLYELQTNEDKYGADADAFNSIAG
mgnify:CR=1 FL=1